MKRQNQTFVCAKPSHLNACVGENGNPTYVQYAIGFSQAANLLIDQVIEDDIKYPVDDFIYPVCFNMRHSVELRLKGAITELQILGTIAGKNLDFDLSGSHDIGRIWNFFKTKSESFDSRYQAINQKIEPTVLDIADVDATGQTFRYPVSTESQKHLVEVGNINFVVLKERFNSLEAHLDTLLGLNDFLIIEYEQDSFIPRLSRVQLFQLALDLPDYSDWHEEKFNETKIELKKKYGLSSNLLSNAINIIKNHYELAPMIGLRVELLGISKEELIKFLTYWHQYHEDAKEKTLAGPTVTSSASIDLFGYIERTSNQRVEICKDASSWITGDKLAGLKALFYFARDFGFSERYIVQYDRECASLPIHQNLKDFEQTFMDLIRKTNGFSNILKSLFFLKHNELAKELIEHFDWIGVFHWQERAETRELFRLPSYSQYRTE
ncbi:hypothetical protein UB37_19060 [Photobacterium iliopiscarium]|uniref:Uncharacterized protein n=1 Tax=Photobacterium iliopiscarium TaxID=56192 RepID=A0ABX5GMF4_9GAMM|nr:hypothetical protein [Photobacterium iliopiscarium]KJG19288.1 hypothetical protein UB37_19060 [Photobacterium iliopiscarium]PSW92197.1 hypothetical protein C9J52_19105 [Photobacterium iliopiscarium]